MKKLMTRKPAAATSTKPEGTTADSTPVTQVAAPSTSTSANIEKSTAPVASPNKAEEQASLQNRLKEIQKKTGNKFTLEEIQREYELTGNNEKTTLINLLKQKEEEEALQKRNLFKRIEEVHSIKTPVKIDFIPNPKSHLLEVLEVVYDKGDKTKSKPIKLYHSKLKEVMENFAKPSPDHVIHINRND